jgi:hypothetical protein
VSSFLKGILPSQKGFQGGEMQMLFQIGLFRLIEETHVSLEIKPSKLEGGA